MGGGSWDTKKWSDYASRNISGRAASQILNHTGARAGYLARDIAFRESRFGPDNPNATPIIIGADVTGSMGVTAEILVRDHMNTLFKEIIERMPVPNPHVMGMAVGDLYTDGAPLQCTQFEADLRVVEQLRDLWIECGGGGNGGESYSAAHLFAAMKTSTDAFEKQGRKGYLFTVGDEPNLLTVTKDSAATKLGIPLEGDLSAEECLALAQRTYEVFHVVLVNEGYCVGRRDDVVSGWRRLLPERTILLDDLSKFSEVVVSAIQVIEGARKVDVVSSWSGGTAVTVAKALEGIGGPRQGGVRRLTAA